MRLASRIAAALTAATAVAGAAGCTAGPEPPTGSPTGSVMLRAAPPRELYDGPVTVEASGLAPGSEVTLAASSTAGDGTTWTSSARFTASAAGAVSTRQASTSGSYTGANPMGLFQTLAPGGDPTQQARFGLPQGNWTVDLTAQVDGASVASTRVVRLQPLQVGVRVRDVRPARDDGLYGELALPPSTTTPRPGVVVIGGSEGGLATGPAAALLAARGYPALALAYFGEPGLPAQLQRIPVEYFARALQWLARQPGVDPRRLVIWGTSRGSEAALLTGASFPRLVAGVVAGAPSDVVMGGLPDTSVPAWTLAGRPVPPGPIPITRIRGPVFAFCGEDDGVWSACLYVRSMGRRLAAAGSPRPTLLRYPGAGHLVSVLLPNYPITVTETTEAVGILSFGGTPAADAAARADAWPRLLDYLRQLRA